MCSMGFTTSCQTALPCHLAALISTTSTLDFVQHGSSVADCFDCQPNLTICSSFESLPTRRVSSNQAFYSLAAIYKTGSSVDNKYEVGMEELLAHDLQEQIDIVVVDKVERVPVVIASVRNFVCLSLCL